MDNSYAKGDVADNAVAETHGFRYRPLRSDRREIRLIYVQALLSDDRICCVLRHAFLDDLPEYAALSYVWGDKNTTKAILLGDHEFHVTENLESALRHFIMNRKTHDNESVALWVDAICIDQSNVSERTHQVSQMDMIYKEASWTIIWLGPSTEDSDLALDSLKTMSKTAESKFWGLIKSWSLFQFQADPLPGSREYFVQTELDSILEDLCDANSRKLNALGSLFARPWFRRVWVIQERALSSVPVVCCGEHLLTWSQFYAGFWVLCGLRDYLHMVRTGPQRSPLPYFLTSKLMNVTPVAYTAPNQPLLSLLTVLYGNSNKPRLEASDERDYVFSVLGLVDASRSPYVRADYSKDWATVRIEVAKACLIHYGLDLLSFCGINSTPETPDRLSAPSWAPDWANETLLQPLSVSPRFVTRGGGKGSAYNACSSLSQFVYEESFDLHNHLQLSAVHFDKISKPGDPLLDDSFITPWLEDLQELLDDGGEAYHTEEAVYEALWRTPIADRAFVHNYETSRASRRTKHSYLALFSGTVSSGVQYVDIVQDKLHGRRPFRTSKGFLGIGPESLLEDDSVWIFPGAHVPFVLRNAGQGCWVVVGEAYVHGIMDGDALDQASELQNISLA